MRNAARPSLAVSLAAGLAAALLVVGAPTRPANGAPQGLQSVTYDVGTRTERRDTVARHATDASRRAARAIGRAGFLPASLDDADEMPSPRKVFGGDDREPVYDVETYPWSAVAKVYSTFPDGAVFEGSAVMVDHDQALTAGHVVYSSAHGGWASDVEVIPGYDLGYAPFGSYYAADIRAFSGWTDQGDYAYDIAVLDLDADAGDLTGWLGVAARSDTDILGSLMNTAGYPADLDDGLGMWYAADYAADVDATGILMNGALDASGGQSGSGVWLRDGDDRFVVGVVSTESRSYNVAARITGEIFDVLDAWLDGYEGPADLSPTSVDTDLPFVVSPGASGSVTFEVDNFGLRPAAAEAAVYLDAGSGARYRIGGRSVSVAAGEYVAVSVPVSVPSGMPAGTYEVVVVTDPSGLVVDADSSNDEAVGPVVTIRSVTDGGGTGSDVWEPVSLPARVNGRLVPGGESRYSFDVASGASKLVLRLKGRRFLGFAIVVRPDGSTFQLLPRLAYKIVENQPQAGEWLVLVKNRPDAGRSRRFKLRMRVR